LPGIAGLCRASPGIAGHALRTETAAPTRAAGTPQARKKTAPLAGNAAVALSPINMVCHRVIIPYFSPSEKGLHENNFPQM